jgi:deoxyribodipyrimidine photo-lyase
MVLNEAKKVGKKEGKLESGRDSGVGMWVQEVSWRDFYNHVSCVRLRLVDRLLS